MDLNKVMLIGNMTRDPELRYTPAGQAVASFSVATNRRWTNNQTGEQQEQAEFHNIVAWAKLAETANQLLTKGRKVYVEGRLQTRSWEGQDGVKKYRTEIVADNLIVLDKKPGQADGDTATVTEEEPQEKATNKDAKPKDDKKGKKKEEEVDDINVDDIPF